MKSELKNLFDDSKIDYGDVRFENNNQTEIRFENEDLKEVKSSYREGGHLRVYNRGVKAVNSFSQLNDAPQVKKELADSIAGTEDLVSEKAKLKPAEVIKDKHFIETNSNPKDYSLEEKKELLEGYNRLALEQDNVIKTDFTYRDFYSRRIFINSEGSEIEYDLLGSLISGAVYAKKDDIVQIKRVSFGGFPEFENLLNREDDLLKEIDILQQMLDADPIKAGNYPVIINQALASVFIHEAFGHLSEADIVKNNPAFRDKLQAGKKLGKEILTVIDDPGIKNTPANYKYDDEGQPGQKTTLIDRGILSGRLHSRETAADFGEPLSGNMRAVDCKYPPIIRMSNIYIAEGESEVEAMISSIDNGYYICNGRGGQTTGDQFTFGAEYGYKIENGQKKGMVRDINLSGELFATLNRISMVGNDLNFREVGGCGKGSPMQINIFSGMGAPHIKVDQVNIGGV
ncbi:MAG: TldD/PmbA family protein [Halarsenatibacteraceae bacterium]